MLEKSVDHWLATFCDRERLPPTYRDHVPAFARPLAQRVAALRDVCTQPVLIGISGGQGSGKSTFAQVIAAFLRHEMSLSAAVLSLDDFYLDKAGRREMAHRVHPLFATRGVPGTHDMDLLECTLAALANPRAQEPIAVPVFDKLTDSRLPEAAWPRIETAVDIVFLEGWCVGARKQAPYQLLKPVNALESEEDVDGEWRRHVNAQLESRYGALFATLDALIMLRIPSFSRVLEWRGLQESKLRGNRSANPSTEMLAVRNADAELTRFIMHFERLTRHMLATMPAYADSVIDIDEEHRFAGMRHEGWEILGLAKTYP